MNKETNTKFTNARALVRGAPNRDYQTRREKETFNDENWVYMKRIYIRIVEVTYLSEWKGEMKFEIIVSRPFSRKSRNRWKEYSF
jgi:hypothetical protein